MPFQCSAHEKALQQPGQVASRHLTPAHFERMAVAITARNSKHSKLRTLCSQWLRKHKPIVYRILSKKASEGKVSSSQSNNSEGR